MSETYDIRLYKLSKVVVKDLEKAVILLDNTLASLYPYRRYSNVKVVWQTAYDNKKLIELHLKKYKNIEKKKGRIE